MLIRFPELPNDFYRYDCNGKLYKIEYGSFYIVHELENPGYKHQLPIGTLLVEINFRKDRKPGQHWLTDNRTHISAIPLDVIYDRVFRMDYAHLGHHKNFITRIKNEEHYFELVLKY